MRRVLQFFAIVSPFLMVSPSSAEIYGDEHCFNKRAHAAGAIRYSVGPSEQVLNDVESEAFSERVWQLRKLDKTWLNLNRTYAERLNRLVREDSNGNPYLVRRGNVDWVDALTIRGNQRHADRQARKSGSKITHITPSMRQLSREQAALRRVQRRDCNPHVTYLGG